jgi:hypothetical protein
VLIRLDLFNETANGIVRAAEVTFCLKFKISHQTGLWAPQVGVVAEFVFHFPKQNPPGVHVGLSDETKTHMINMSFPVFERSLVHTTARCAS